MKKAFAFLVALTLTLTMFAGITAFASGGIVITAEIGADSVTVECEAGTFASGEQVSFQLFVNGNMSYLGQFPSEADGSFSRKVLLGFMAPGPLVEGDVVKVILSASSTGPLTPEYTVKPDEPDPVVPLASLAGDAGITITRPDPLLPFLVNPESAQAKDLFDEANILGGTGFNFGEHKYTSAPQEINSLNSLSMIYGYLDPFNEVFTVTCEISDFLMEDDTPLFTDFSLYMGRQNNYFDRDFESEYYASSKAKVYESKASFDLAKNDPVVVVKTDAVGHVLTNYIGVLKLQQDTTKTVGAANATITWEIGIEVI